MNDLYPGCTVAPLSKCNHATLPLEDATEGATSTATNGLIALAIQVLERTNATRAATPLQLTGCKSMQLGGISEVCAIFKKSCIVASPKGGNRATIIKKGKCGDCKYFLPEFDEI